MEVAITTTVNCPTIKLQHKKNGKYYMFMYGSLHLLMKQSTCSRTVVIKSLTILAATLLIKNE